MTNALNGFKRITAGHYRHDETGIEIVKVPAHREHGYAVGVRWHITVPQPGAARDIYSGAGTLRDAIDWATTGKDSFVERMRAAIAKAWDEAHAEHEALAIAWTTVREQGTVTVATIETKGTQVMIKTGLGCETIPCAGTVTLILGSHYSTAHLTEETRVALIEALGGVA